MPHIKNALIRFRIIDKMIRNKYKSYPSKQELREACEESLYGSIDGVHICNSTIEKDLFNMKMEHDAPIKYSKKNRGYYYEDSSYSINDSSQSLVFTKPTDSLPMSSFKMLQFKTISKAIFKAAAIQFIKNCAGQAALQRRQTEVLNNGWGVDRAICLTPRIEMRCAQIGIFVGIHSFAINPKCKASTWAACRKHLMQHTVLAWKVFSRRITWLLQVFSSQVLLA